ncbi:glycosyltransferase family 39 protein [Bacillus sp. 28A-2]|uniref:ArnT family glycosyltransferase n=1 Tax=Bacillus sp. 28A-2 TaxID=2772252 RepID=UPI00168CE15E|nr:glycosyltransferase family 39 protein [Bacillus sp. 28A-2]MBD3858369.1 glycosyltransferase family 39 protein [Bacillus sp. 28A-2]
MKNRKVDMILVMIVLIAAFLYTYQIWQNDSANQYYLAAVKSMSKSFHHFFYASFDATGFVSIDKPPVVLWIQTISALIFGFHTWSVILPQALAGIGSVLLLYLMIKPAFGKGAARVSAAVMALTPIAAAVSRTNNIDSMLVFTLLAGAYFLMRAVKNGRMRWLLMSFVLIAIGFNMKMLQAFMVLPAFIFYYVIAARVSWKKKIVSLLCSLVVLVCLSLSWAVAVDMTAESDRPYVGSSQTNSVLELAFGYNGTERLLGQTTGKSVGEMNQQAGAMMPDSSGINGTSGGQSNKNQPPPSQNQMMPSHQGPAGGGPPGSTVSGQSMNMYGTGNPGVFRLFQSALSGQISWMLPFALFGLLGMVISWWRERKARLNEWKQTLFWTAWLIPVAGFFSIAGFFHHYYLIMLAPPIAALCGIGAKKMGELFTANKGMAAYLLPAAIAVTAIFQGYILSNYTSQISSVWMYTIAIAGLSIAILLLMYREKQLIKKRLTIIALTTLLLIPGYWAATPIIYGGNSVLPEAGVQLSSSRGGNMFTSSVDQDLLTYLKAHQTGETYLFATLTTVTAAPYIIDEDENVMALGGFNGTDPILTVNKLKALIQQGKVKYFLLPDNQSSANSDLVNWIKSHGTVISTEEYKDQSSSTAEGMPNMSSQNETLYRVDGIS